jgi:hypothetical protein
LPLLLLCRPLLGVLSICQCDMWSALVGIVAAVVLYLCINQLPQQLPGARQQQHQAAGGAAAGAGAGSTAHLHNAVPAGAPEAVARILQASPWRCLDVLLPCPAVHCFWLQPTSHAPGAAPV